MRSPLTRLIPRAIRKRMAEARRARSHHQRFEDGKQRILERKGQFDEWHYEWVRRRDELARRKAVKTLEEIHELIRRLWRNNHRQQLVEFLIRQHIPGWRRATLHTSSRRR